MIPYDQGIDLMGVVSRSCDDSHFEHLLERAEPRLKAVLARFRIPPQDADDLLQQTLLAYLHKHQQVQQPEAWLLGTLRDRCLMYWRSRRRRLYEAVDSSILESIAEPRRPSQEIADICRDLEMVIARLPERCQDLLKLRYRLGCGAPETAERLGYSTSSIYKVTERCLAALTRELVEAGLRDED